MQRAPDKNGSRMPFRDSAESTGAILSIPGTPPKRAHTQMAPSERRGRPHLACGQT